MSASKSRDGDVAGGDLPDGRVILRTFSDPHTGELLFDVVGASRAERTVDEEPVAPLLIAIGGRFPRAEPGDPSWMEAHAARFRGEARSIALALRRSLPGGTLDCLAGELLAFKASQLLVTAETFGGARDQSEARAPARSPERPESSGDRSPSVGDSGFMTWRDLGLELARLLTSESAVALDQEVVLRIDDGDSLHCGGLRSIDVDDGCGEFPALVFDGDQGGGRSCWREEVGSPAVSSAGQSARGEAGCSDLTPFIDGELGREGARRFRVHLGSCDACAVGLLEGMQLSTRLAALDDQILSAEDRATLEDFIRRYRASRQPDLRLRACAVEAALATFSGGQMLDAELAGVLLSLGGRCRRDHAWRPLSGAILALLGLLGLGDGGRRGGHAPLVEDSPDRAFPGVRLVGCSCGWRIPDAGIAQDMLALHVAEVIADDAVADHENARPASRVQIEE